MVSVQSLFIRLALAGMLAALAACGGGGGGGGKGGSGSGDGSGGANTGVLTDSPVAGVEYRTSAGKSGLTTAEGRFNYKPGNTVTFRIGALVLGTVATTGANAVVTPLQLAESAPAELRARVATNLMILLQSLDSDGNPENGIVIDPALRTVLTDTVAATLDLQAEPETFAASTVLAELAPVAPVTPQRALTHFRRQFLQDLAGIYSLTTASGEAIAFRLNADGGYIMGEVGPEDEVGQSGIERGALRWDPATGEATASVEQDTNGGWGLSDVGPGKAVRLYLSRDGDALLMKVDVADPAAQDEVRRFRRHVPGGELDDDLFGGWALHKDDFAAVRLEDVPQVFFLANGHYLLLDPVGADAFAPGEPTCSGSPGLEYGPYSFNGTWVRPTGSLVDSNGCAGLHDTTTGLFKENYYGLSILFGEAHIIGNKAFLLRPDTSSLRFTGRPTVASTSGPEQPLRNGSHELTCSPDGAVGDTSELERSITLDPVNGLVRVYFTARGQREETQGVYDSVTGDLYWAESISSHFLRQEDGVSYFQYSNRVFRAKFNRTQDVIVGTMENTVSNTWSVDTQFANCNTLSSFRLEGPAS